MPLARGFTLQFNLKKNITGDDKKIISDRTKKKYFTFLEKCHISFLNR